MKHVLLALMAATIVVAPCEATRADVRLSVLTYNVHGLPWPLASGRTAAMRAIAARLRGMRAAGTQPDVVALQEAFGEDAKAIGHAAGYRYVAFGPAVGQPAPPTARVDRAFMDTGSRFAGERLGKYVDSGLAIFSDHPILATRRIAYRTCAGYDCLANKGALAALIAVPGAGPITVVNTHLNSARASGASVDRHRYAYLRQIEQLASFERALAGPNSALLVAGDFNVGRDLFRDATFRSRLVGGGRPLAIAATWCGGSDHCAVGDAADVRLSLARRKDWLLYRASAVCGVHPAGIAALFGRGRDGAMLSDHIGLMVRYGLVLASGQASPFR